MEQTSAPTRAPTWATPAFVALAVLLLTLPRAILAARVGLIGDEAYYAIWSFYPGFGYFDHSPAVAWFVWLGRAIFGEGEFAVRSMFLAANLVTCAALYRTGECLTGDRRVGAVAALAYAVIPAAIITFTVATPDGPSTMFWALSIWAVAEFVRGRNANWWLAAGAFAGLGLLSKYTVAFLGLGLIFYLVTSRERLGWLKHWQVWAGGALAVALFSPVLWIYGHRGWNSLRYQLGRSSLEHPDFRGFGELGRFLTEEAIQLLPTLAVFVALGIALFLMRRAKSMALPLLTAAPMLGYFLVHALFGRVNPNWTAPLFAVLSLAGAYAVVTVRPNNWLRWPLDLLRIVHLPLGLAIVAALFVALATRALPIIGPLPVIDYVNGWADLQRKVSALARDNGAQWVDAPDYSLNGWLGYYGRMANDPLPVFQTNQPFRYAYMPPMDPALEAAPHLILREGGGRTPPEGAKSLGIVTRNEDGRELARYRVYLVPARPAP